MNNYIFDLDGTLIDASERMYQLFKKLIPISTFSKAQYWELKRNGINHKMILERYFPDYEFEKFNLKWLNLIEQNEYLDMDINYPDTINVLSRIKEDNNIILLTARQSRERLISELKRLNLFDYFYLILVTEAKLSKEELLTQHGVFNSKKTIYISDMGKDIAVGNKLGFFTVAITHGFMSEMKLQEYRPNCLVHDLSELLQMR